MSRDDDAIAVSRLGTERVATDRQSLWGVLALRGFRSLLGLLGYG